MPGLVSGIRVVDVTTKGKTWMAGTSPAMTVRVGRPRLPLRCHINDADARHKAGHDGFL